MPSGSVTVVHNSKARHMGQWHAGLCLVNLVLLQHAVAHEGREVLFRDGLARRQVAISEHDIRAALLHGLYLTGQRLEERGGPHNGVRQRLGRLQVSLKLELGLLELQQRFLHADRGQQDIVGAARRHRRIETILRRLHARPPQ